MFPKAASPKLLPKAVVLQSNCSSMLPQNRKVAVHSCSPKLLLFPKTPKLLPEAASKLAWKAVQSCSPKLLPGAAPQSCAPKLFSKAVAPKLRFCKTVHQNGSPKPFCKAAPESCAPKLLYRKLLSEVVCKAAPESRPPKLLLFKAIVRQSCSGKLAKAVLPKAALQSGSPQLLPKAVPQTTAAKRFPQSCYGSNLFPKAILQSGS